MNEIVRSAFSAAASFHEAAIRCLPSGALPIINPLAGTVNIAFACELYLKTNLISVGVDARGHSLRQLYNQLPDEQSQEIADQYSMGLRVTDTPFISALDDVSDAFIDWRYIYERERSEIHIGALWRLARVLFKFTDSRHRDPDMTDWQRKRLTSS